MSDVNRTPTFCAVCGTRLTSRAEIKGYDPYSGEPLTLQKFSCPNPTVVTTKLNLRTATVQHPTWSQGDTSDSWVQSDPLS